MTPDPAHRTSGRGAAGVLHAVETAEGDGMIVRRPFPHGRIDQIDPFLLLDEMGPRDLAPGQARGAPDHPHRGFETVSYILEGELEHEDSVGNHGWLRAGDVQWMTAGAGVVHSEMPSRRMQEEGGRIHGFQVWVNLPADQKMRAPRYQEVPAASIPEVSLDEGRADVRVIAGSVAGVAGPVAVHSPITYLHLRVLPGGTAVLPAPRTMNAMLYGIAGDALVGAGANATAVERGLLVVLDKSGDTVVVSVPDSFRAPFSGLFLAGEPIGEPIARYGPFVMNTRAELVQAVEDFQAGRLGAIAR